MLCVRPREEKITIFSHKMLGQAVFSLTAHCECYNLDWSLISLVSLFPILANILPSIEDIATNKIPSLPTWSLQLLWEQAEKQVPLIPTSRMNAVWYGTPKNI